GQNGCEMTISASGSSLKDRGRALLIGSHDEGVAQTLQKATQSESARDGAEKLAGLEIDPLWRRRCLASGITLDFRSAVASIGVRIPGNRIVVEHAQNFRHVFLPIDVPPSRQCP